MKKVNVAVVGATGMVGRTFLKVLEERQFPIENIYFFSSKKSAGSTITFEGKDYTVEELTETAFDGKNIQIALFSAGGATSEKFAPIAASKGIIVVDNSAQWRMDPDVPLIVPEVNPEAIKEIKNVRKYVSVDGGMTDNIRPSLYQADYECGIVNKINKTGHNHKVTIAGKCCESGDILISDTEIGDINSGDILITTTTGAYGYSMASNYNKIPKNPVVFVQNGEDKLACKRQSYEDLLALEV